ncbi:MAG: hypothetical protein KGO96_14255 [Elusimicrobia bacterium]|nr:hypothetical protein [Elusimicrobiota bacterium]MDE2427057.1 hypothetical protein [Elusimicrobiota bacterium]
MNKAGAFLSLLVSSLYAARIFRHMVSPGRDADFSKTLTCICLMAVPMVAIQMFPWILRDIIRRSPDGSFGGGSFGDKMGAWLGLPAIFVVLPIIFMAALLKSFDRPVLFTLGFFFPMLASLIIASPEANQMAAVQSVLLYFAAGFSAAALVPVLTRARIPLAAQERNFHHVWPGYGDPLKMFFMVCLFGLYTQIWNIHRSVRWLRARPAAARRRGANLL